jgi:hypothetical protein
MCVCVPELKLVNEREKRAEAGEMEGRQKECRSFIQNACIIKSGRASERARVLVDFLVALKKFIIACFTFLSLSRMHKMVREGFGSTHTLSQRHNILPAS